MANLISGTISEVKGELKPAKIVAFIVMLIVAGFVLSFLSKKFAPVAKVNPLPVK